MTESYNELLNNVASTRQPREPIVSVAMVVRNVDRFLAEAIDSILCQSLYDFEFIIVDFGSTDNTKAIIEEYAIKDCRIKFHVIPPCGLSEARNAASFLAKGRYIAVMDADDISVKDRLKWQVEYLETHPDVAIVGGFSELIDSAGRSLHIVQDQPIEDAEIQSTLLHGTPGRPPGRAIHQPTVVMRRDAFCNVGGYRAAFAPAEDYDLFLRMAEYFKLANLENVVVKYRLHPYQVSLRKRQQQTFGSLAAQATALLRRGGQPDPLSSVPEITSAVLAGLGVGEEAQQACLARDYLGWVRNMCRISEYSVALRVADEMLRSCDWKYAEKWVIADLQLTIARLYWRNQEFTRSFIAAMRAFITRPIILGRPLKMFIQAQFTRQVN